jgi:hypothetical protein
MSFRLGPRRSLLRSPAVAAAGGGDISSPTELANLFAWYKGDTGITAPGGLVSDVQDQHTGNFDLGVPGGNVSIGSYNGHDALDFSAATGSLFTNSTFGISGTDCTIFWVGTFDTATDTFGRFFSITAGAGNDYETDGSILINRDNTNAALSAVMIGGSPTSAITSTLVDDAHHTFCATFDGSVIQWYIDGSADGTAGSYPGTSFVASNKLLIMTSYLSGSPGSGHGVGLMAEIAIYDRALLSSEVVQLHDYAVARVGS